MAVVCSAAVSYKKQAGELRLLKSKVLEWSPQAGASSGALQLPARAIKSLFASKPGSAKVILRVNAVLDDSDAEQALNFTFTAASSNISDREQFKIAVADLIAEYQQVSKGKQRAVSTDAPSPAPATADGAAAYEPALRIRLLRKTPELRQLHADLVLKGVITEDEFWQGREQLLAAQQMDEGQKQGRSAQIVDPRPETGDGGEVKITVTPQLIADIFMQYPIVQRAYSEHVPPVC